MIAILQRVKSIRNTLFLEILLVLCCWLLSALVYHTTSRSIAFMVTFGMVSFLPFILGILAVAGAGKLDSPEIVAASFKGLKGELAKRFTFLLTGTIVFVVILYFSLSSSGGWPRDRGIYTLVYFSLGVVLLALSGLFAMFLGHSTKIAILTVTIVWIGFTFVIDPYIQSIVIARVIPLLILFCLTAIAFRRLEDGKLLMAMEGEA